MSIGIKNDEEIALMREAGRRLAAVHQEIGHELHEGMTTKEVDDRVYTMIKDFHCEPNFLNYQGFPASVCVSVNDEVVHGIPGDRVLLDGDIVSLDMGLVYKGYHSDAARTHGIGEISPKAKKLIERTRESFFQGIQYAYAGRRLHEISRAIGDYAESYGYGVVYELVGHGIGRHLHEEPEIPNFRQWRRGPKLRPGMTLAIEPMINAGCAEVYWMDDGWTVVTDDGELSAHYENTILITKGDPEILTLTEEEPEFVLGCEADEITKSGSRTGR